MDRKICVVGVGRWGKNHARTLAELGFLAGIVDSEESTLQEMKQLYPQARLFTNIREAIDGDFDAFTVATPAETHFEVGKFIIEHNKPLLIEKPLAMTLAEAQELKSLSESKQVNMMVGHVLLFHPAIRTIKQLIDSGKIGKVQYLYSNRLNLGTVRTEENILWSFAPHDISIFQYLIGTMPTQIISRGGAYLQTHIHDTTMTILTYPDNVLGHIFVSWLHPFKEHRLVVIGSKGMLSFEDSSESKELLFYEKGIDWVQGEPIKRQGPTESIPYEKKMPLTEELQYFADHLEGIPIEVAGGQNAVEVLEILETATESLLSGTQVDLQGAEDKPAEKPPYFVHPSSLVDDNVEIGEGTKIWHFSHILSNAKIGKKCTLGQNVSVANNVCIGDYVKVQNNVSIYEGVTLEDYVFCGPSMVFTNVKDPRCKYPQRGSGFYLETLVKEGASIGANATIVCGNTIGRHAFVGAGSVVTRDVPDYALVVGVPARRVGWACECGEVLPECDQTVCCPRCGLKYKLEQEQLVPDGKA